MPATAAATSATLATMKRIFMKWSLSGGLRRAGVPRRCGVAPAGYSGFFRDAGVDGQSVDSTRHQGVQRIIYEAVPGNAGQAFEARADDADAEVAALARAGMAGVEMAVVRDLEALRRQGR